MRIATTLADQRRLVMGQPTTVVDLTHDEPALIRQGRGDAHRLGLSVEADV